MIATKVRSISFCACLVGTLLLAACANKPLDQPADVVAAPDSAAGTVIWGGVILSSANLDDATQFEVLAYPLDRRQRPMTGREAQGRFLVLTPGYVETVDYAVGRQLTVLGSLQGVTEGTVGEARYDFPTLDASKLHLWHGDGSREEPRFTFGIGVNLSN